MPLAVVPVCSVRNPVDDSPRLSQRAREREVMTAPGTECFVSAVSFCEIAIKLTQDAALVPYGKTVSVA